MNGTGKPTTQRHAASPHDTEAEVERMLAMGREIRAHMTEPVTSDLSELYDEEGFPIEDHDIVHFDIEPALKA